MWLISFPSLLLYVCRSITCALWLACMSGGVVIRMAVMSSVLVSYQIGSQPIWRRCVEHDPGIWMLDPCYPSCPALKIKLLRLVCAEGGLHRVSPAISPESALEDTRAWMSCYVGAVEPSDQKLDGICCRFNIDAIKKINCPGEVDVQWVKSIYHSWTIHILSIESYNGTSIISTLFIL